MREFTFESYQEWFNDNYLAFGYCLDEGPYPYTGEVGLHEINRVPNIIIFPEGLEIGTRDNCVANLFIPSDPNPKVIPKSCLDKETIEEYDIHPEDYRIIDKTLYYLNTSVMVIPFFEKYIKLYENVAIDYTGVSPKISLEDFLGRE